MMWMSVYAVAGVAAAIAVFLAAEWLRMPGVPAPDNPGRYAIAAGLIWPILLLGIAQWGLIAMVAARMRRSARPVSVATPQRVPQPTAR